MVNFRVKYDAIPISQELVSTLSELSLSYEFKHSIDIENAYTIYFELFPKNVRNDLKKNN